MLLVSFLLWLCGYSGIFVPLQPLQPSAQLQCEIGTAPQVCLWRRKSLCIFRCFSCCFFLYDTAFLFVPLPFLLLSLLATSVAAVYNYTEHWEKGRH